MNVEMLMKIAGSVRTGGKGTPRRKKKAVQRQPPQMTETSKHPEENRLALTVVFLCYLVQASIAANTWVISGTPQNKKLQDILPQIIHQLGPDNLENLKKLAEQFQKQEPVAGATLELKHGG
ncbi:Hypothetical predicted protein [Olea europaea subsp. europaea]|nr:Hypothetical predicted protein [Olea europaea subsp. europaea]